MTDRHSTTDPACEPIELDNTTPIHDPSLIANKELIGERFGNYLLVGEIAVGGMAEVFLGVKEGLEGFLKVVVVKRVLPHLTDTAQFIRMFIDEARVAARLDHPNIVRTYEFGDVAGQLYTVMEFLAGEDLRSVLRKLSQARQLLPMHVAAGIVAKLCAGLSCAHQLTDTAGRPLNLVHRDVNPANIVITYGGEVKVIDFGVAKTNTTATVTRTIKGKLAYMPPEQVLARGVDQRSDIFSAGVVLWELLTGRRLFARESDAATIYAIMNDVIAPPSRYRQGVSRELDAIVMRALSRNPADRFATAADMEATLEDLLASLPKCDARVLVGIVEDLFGLERAAAMRAISQTRALRDNIGRVMKLRTAAPTPPPDATDSLAVGTGSTIAPAPVALPTVAPPRRRPVGLAIAGVVIACVAGAAAYVAARPHTESAAAASPAGALVIESIPAGAAISIGGEPTGLRTPATLAGLAAHRISVRVELAGYGAVAQDIDVPSTGTLAKRFELVPAIGH